LLKNRINFIVNTTEGARAIADLLDPAGGAAA
jgi:hypothetical protein